MFRISLRSEFRISFFVMALFFQHNINEHTKLGIWHIEEPEDFFLTQVPLQQDIHHPHKRLQHLAGRYLLPFLFPGFPHELIEIAATNKPFLPDEAYHFSISHCGNYAAAIVSRTHRVGIDIEVPTPKVARVQHKFMLPAEMMAIERRPTETPEAIHREQADYIQKLTLVWSAKEAVYKWYGSREVSLSHHIRVMPPEEGLLTPGRGVMEGLFSKDQTRQLALPYICFNEICLVWVISV